MARLAERHPGNAPGDWYVDDRCVACDVARQHARSEEHTSELQSL